jgi:hypothetical protein
MENERKRHPGTNDEDNDYNNNVKSVARLFTYICLAQCLYVFLLVVLLKRELYAFSIPHQKKRLLAHLDNREAFEILLTKVFWSIYSD